MVSAWSIGTGKRGDLKSSSMFVPGPGAYTVDKFSKIIPPKWKFGLSNRQSMVANDAPGPGQYNLKNSQSGPKFSIGTGSKPKVETYLFVPGPGTYNPGKTIYQSSPNYSMGMKHSSSEQHLQPGPGQYDHKSSVLNQPSVKFPLSTRNELYQGTNTPGPANYNVSRPSSAAPKFGFGTSQRDQLYASQQTPGPGQYDQKSCIDLSKGVTMISRRANGVANEIAKFPGPGAYNPTSKNKKQNPAFKIGTQTRDTIDKESGKIPGPGWYSPRIEANRPQSPQIKVGSDQRKPLNLTINNPGPGQYNVRPQTADGPKLSFKGVSKPDPVERERMKVPGPGSYQPSEIFIKERPSSAKIGTSLRPSMYKLKDAPGPGNYNIRAGEHGPKWGFGTSLRPQSKRGDEPGPGAYNIPVYFADVPKFMMTSQPKFNFP
ncbi:hypothetical protein ABPG74_011309 [Tetrahymena malaccensis]